MKHWYCDYGCPICDEDLATNGKTYWCTNEDCMEYKTILIRWGDAFEYK